MKTKRFARWRRVAGVVLLALLLGTEFSAARGQQPPPAMDPELDALGRQATQAQVQGDYNTALRLFQAAVSRARAVGDRRDEAVFTADMGVLLVSIARNAEAIPYYKQAIIVFRAAGLPAETAATYANLGLVYYNLGQLKPAEENGLQALAIQERLNDPAETATMLSDLGNTFNAQGRFQKALTLFQRGYDIQRNLNKPFELGDTLNGMGNAYDGLGDAASAEHCLQDALKLKQQTGDKKGGAHVFNNLGNVYLSTGQYEKAMDAYRQALDLKQQVGDPLVSSSIVNIGSVYRSQGRFDQALAWYQRGLTLAQQKGNKAETAGALVNIGVIYSGLGQSGKALDYYTRALALQEEIHSLSDAALLLGNIGTMLMSDERLNEALPFLKRAMELNNQTGNKRGQAADWKNLAQVYTRQKQYPQALEGYEKAIALQKTLGGDEALASMLNDTVVLYEQMKRPEEARQNGEQSLALRRKIGNKQDIALASANLARLETNAGNIDRAKTLFDEAVHLNEAVVEQVDTSQVGAYQEKSAGPLYTEYAALLLAQKKPEEALAMVERGRAQGLARQIAQNRRGLTALLPGDAVVMLQHAQTEYATAERVWRHNDDLDALTDSDAPGDLKAQLVMARERFEAAQQTLADVRKTLAAKYPDFGRAQGAKPVAAADLMALAKRNPDTLYLEWAVNENAQTSLFALTAESGIQTFTIPPAKPSLREEVQKWREAIADLQGDGKAERDAAHQIYATLFGDLETRGLLTAGKYARLVLVGDGPLLDVPWAALLDGNGKRLIERFPLSVSVSLGVLTWPTSVRQEKAPVTLLVVADPLGAGKSSRIAVSPLPAAREEGRVVASLFPGATVLLGDMATRRAVEPRMAQSALLHFATHGALDDEDGMRSGLALAPEDASQGDVDILDARDIVAMHLSARLAVLSACETAQGQKSGGEGMIGLTWAFRAAGCPSVVASQWSVEDKATEKLMVAFYEMLQAGKRKDDALRAAILAVKVLPGSQAPFFWAAFQLAGDTSPL